MCIAASTATCQKPRDRPAWCNMLVPFSIMVLLNLSALPFCCGEWGIVSLCSIPKASNIVPKSLLTYSPLRSECRHLIWASNCFSAQALYKSKVCLNSDLAFKMTTTVFEKSSRKVAKYVFPCIDLHCRGPTESLWTISSGDEVHLDDGGNGRRELFPSSQP